MSLLPSCRDVSKLLSEALDSGRPLGLHVRLHLSICDVCRRVLAQFALIRRGAARARRGGVVVGRGEGASAPFAPVGRKARAAGPAS